uniref:KH_dom_type_1 domain-containing protein n=1 Tax=Steinernema glaseri TaxID=37863 RepID=A0A1I8A2U0_9BILA
MISTGPDSEVVLRPPRVHKRLTEVGEGVAHVSSYGSQQGQEVSLELHPNPVVAAVERRGVRSRLEHLQKEISKAQIGCGQG